MDWLDLLAVQGTLESLLQHHSSKASVLRRSAFFMIHLSHPYIDSGKNQSFAVLAGPVIPLHTKLRVVNFQRCERAFHQHRVSEIAA